MNGQSDKKVKTLLVAALVVAAAGVGAWAVMSMGVFGEGPIEPAPVRVEKKVDPVLLTWRQVRVFDTGLSRPWALAITPNHICVAGDRALATFTLDGKRISQQALPGDPSCLGVGQNNRILVGLGGRIVWFDRDGKTTSIAPRAKKTAYITSIVWVQESLYAADSVNGVVWHTDDAGKTWSQIDGRGADDSGGFVMKSANFDLAAGTDGLLRIVNPGMLRVEVYTLDGMRMFTQGGADRTIGGFAGCCNPAHIAIAPDGSLVTAEKARVSAKIKVFAPAGTLESVVAVESQFSDPFIPLDVAVDARGRVVVLELAKGGQVRVFERKKPTSRSSERSSDE